MNLACMNETSNVPQMLLVPILMTYLARRHVHTFSIHFEIIKLNVFHCNRYLSDKLGKLWPTLKFKSEKQNLNFHKKVPTTKNHAFIQFSMEINNFLLEK